MRRQRGAGDGEVVLCPDDEQGDVDVDAAERPQVAGGARAATVAAAGVVPKGLPRLPVAALPV